MLPFGRVTPSRRPRPEHGPSSDEGLTWTVVVPPPPPPKVVRDPAARLSLRRAPEAPPQTHNSPLTSVPPQPRTSPFLRGRATELPRNPYRLRGRPPPRSAKPAAAPEPKGPDGNRAHLRLGGEALGSRDGKKGRRRKTSPQPRSRGTRERVFEETANEIQPPKHWDGCVKEKARFSRARVQPHKGLTFARGSDAHSRGRRALWGPERRDAGGGEARLHNSQKGHDV